jgi:hypothetical protein
VGKSGGQGREVAASVEVSHELTGTRASRPPEDTRALSPTGTALPLREHAQQAMSVSSPATAATTALVRLLNMATPRGDVPANETTRSARFAAAGLA